MSLLLDPPVTDQLEEDFAVPFGFRSRYYSSAVTAALFYEAEALTAVSGAAVTGLSGASGGEVMEITALPAATWVTMLSTTIEATTGNWTHQGSYRVWARCYSSTGTPEFQFAWGVGSLSVPVTNSSATLPGKGAFYLLDLGEVRIDPPPIGTAEWFGVIQAYSAAGGDNASVDCLYLQPLDDGAGQLTYVSEPSAAATATPLGRPGTVVDSSANGGTVAWSNASALDGGVSSTTFAEGSAGTTHYLEATNLGFDIGSIWTIFGIQIQVVREATPGPVQDVAVQLVKAGTVQATNRSVGAAWTNSSAWNYYGSATDLWGGTWAPSDINNSGFGVVLAASLGSSSSWAQVWKLGVTVYYGLASGFSIAQDAVVYANQSAEIRYDQMYREGPSGTVYGPVSSVVGDLARIPPSGMEGRAVQLFIKPTRGDTNTLPDSGLDSFTVQTFYRPSWIFRP